jgi:transcriptional regulator NrdR family protein
MAHIVKRHGTKEEYDEKKVYASSYAAAMNVHLGEQRSESIAQKVTEELNKWVEGKSEINSKEIFSEVSRALETHDKDAAFMYRTHLDVS